MWRVHTCFRACKSETDTEANGFYEDTRELCTSTDDESLICLEPDSPCENMYCDF